jgi:hypothetical protein
MNEGIPQMYPRPETGANAGSPFSATGGTKDGRGAGDRDQPFDGFRPDLFSTRQLARLLLLRGETLDAKLGLGRFVEDAPAV